MISLRRLIDATNNPEAAAPPPLLQSAKGVPEAVVPLSAYQSVLAAMGASGQRAIPLLGDLISSALARIGERLSRSASPAAVLDAGRDVEQQLSYWADQAQILNKENELAIQDLLRVVAQAAQSNGTRDEKFCHEISQLSERLRAVAGLDNLPLIRRSIAENTSALTSCVTKMADEGRESIRKLTSEIADYQSRLQASERRALVDPLTGISNRRGFEEQLEKRIADRQPFSLLVVDLNDFKIANDRYGHLVGDEILRQFAEEMKTQSRPEDTVARWGGDEFVAIVAGPEKEGTARVDIVRNWVLGGYRINTPGGTVTVQVDAAIGAVAWNGSESGQELFARADREMYKAKESSRAPV